MLADRKPPKTKQELISAISRLNISSIQTFDAEIADDHQKMRLAIAAIPKGAKGISVVVIRK